MKEKIDIILCYIKENIISCRSYNYCLETLENLADFLETLDFEVTDEIIQKLVVKNTVLNTILRSTVFSNLCLINNNQIDERLNHEFILLLIEKYCVKRGIKFDKEKISFVKKNDVIAKADRSYLANITNNQVLDADEERVYLKKIKEGNTEAFNEFIFKNLRLVYSLANSYFNNNIPILDLVQEGTIGLIEAINRFDITKENKFSTYALWILKRSFHNLICNKMFSSSMPEGLKIYKLQMLERSDCLTDEEIAKELDLPIEEFKKLSLQFNLLNIDDIREAEMEENSETTYIDKEESLEEKYERIDLPVQIEKLFDEVKLSKKEKIIISMIYGFDGKGPKTGSQVARIIGCSKQSIDCAEINALRKFRCCNITDDFLEYMDNPSLAKYTLGKYREAYLNPNMKKVINKRNVVTIFDIDEVIFRSPKVTGDEYKSIIQMINTDEFQELKEKFSFKIAVAICLKLGVLINREYSTIQIAELLGVDESSIRDDLIYAIPEYKKEFIFKKNNVKIKV